MSETEKKTEGKDGFSWGGNAVFHGPVTFHGPMFHIHDNPHVEEHIHYHYPVKVEEERRSMKDGEIPAELDAPQARDLMGRLTEAGLLDEVWQPVGLSGAQRGVLAQRIAARLKIANTWKTFGSLWSMKPETLRTAYNKGMEQKSMSDFIGRVNKVLEE